MSDPDSAVRNISDTAHWVAYFRARESQRQDALFRDPYAERLAGDRGLHVAKTLRDGDKQEWAWAARTYLFDHFVSREIQQGADLVVSLAAGLDTRPYRLELPKTLQWIEVDLPEIISYKETILADEMPRCRLERVRLDLLQAQARRALFSRLGRQAKRVTVVAEGLLVYFTPADAASLARDLAAGESFHSWIIDLVSPGQLELMQRSSGKQLEEVGAAFKFAPPEGPGFFLPCGWEPKETQGLLKTAAEFKRAPAELMAYLPEPNGPPGKFPWSGVCLLERL